MTCKSCQTFVGNPCPVCRTCNRIKWLVTVGKLAVEQEAQALQLLRDCAGGIQDLVESAGIYAQDSGPGEEESPEKRETSPEKKKSKKRRKHRSEHIDEEEVKEGEGEKKEKKRKN